MHLVRKLAGLQLVNVMTPPLSRCVLGPLRTVIALERQCAEAFGRLLSLLALPLLSPTPPCLRRWCGIAAPSARNVSSLLLKDVMQGLGHPVRPSASNFF